MVEVGKEYKTVGEWTARVIHITGDGGFFYAIHAPGTPNETVPILHQINGAAQSQFSVAEPPRFGKMSPADILVNSVVG